MLGILINQQREVVNMNKIETVVGFIVLIVAIGFLVFTYKVAGLKKFEETYQLKAKFERVDGIIVGSDVTVSGIKVGSVVSLGLDPSTYNAIMTMAIKSNISLPIDSSVKIVSSGLLGNKYVLIEIGGSEEILTPGDEFKHTQSAINLEGLISKTIFSLSTVLSKYK